MFVTFIIELSWGIYGGSQVYRFVSLIRFIVLGSPYPLGVLRFT